ncbi:MAG: site-2 protease family protein [Bryobacteraceae bacterium]
MRNFFWLRLLTILLLSLPLALLFLAPAGSPAATLIVFWILALLSVFLLWRLLGIPADETALRQERELQPHEVVEEDVPQPVRQVMNVRVADEMEGVQIFRGKLRESAAAAYRVLRNSLSERVIPMMQEDPQDRREGATIILLPKPVGQATLEKPVRPGVHWLLFLLTVVTTTFAGAAHQGVNLLNEPGRFAVGLPYSLGLLGILGCHELGHYFTARYHRMRVTPPYFIPVPFALGTFGAFIQMRSPAENRRHLFDVAVAGPLAGLVIAMPALYFGLQTSTLVSQAQMETQGFGGSLISSSVLFSLLASLSLGDALAAGYALQLSPLAFAGWLGLLVTALNLLPIGQLDGGHIARAMFGTRVGGMISRAALALLFLLALFVWPGLMMWAIIVFFLAGRPTPPLNDLTPLTSGRRAVGVLSFVILAAILVPVPLDFWSLGMRCPYL